MATGGDKVDVDQRSLCEEDTIRHNLVTFMPYIVDCIQVTDLLAYLHYYTKEQRKEIFQASGRNRQDATRKAINMLVGDFDDPGRFIAFKEMAKERGYPKIERILSGTYIPDDANYQKIIDLFTQRITERINPIDLLPSLIKYEVILHTEAEMIRAEESNFGKTRASWLLVFFLPSRVEYWFRLFLESLIDCREHDLAKMLDPDLFEKIMIQRKPCIQDASISSTVGEATCSYEQDMEKDVDNTEANNKPLNDTDTQTYDITDVKIQNSDITDMNSSPIEMEDLKLDLHTAEMQTQDSAVESEDDKSAILEITKELLKKEGELTAVPHDNNKMTRQDSIEEKETYENNLDTTIGAIRSGKDECKISNDKEISPQLETRRLNKPERLKEFSGQEITSTKVVKVSNVDETSTKLEVIYRREHDKKNPEEVTSPKVVDDLTIIENDLSGSPDESNTEFEEPNAEGSIGNENVEVLDTNTARKQIADAIDALDIGSAFLGMKIPKRGNGRIQYGRNFLLACRNSPLIKSIKLPDLAEFPEIMSNLNTNLREYAVADIYHNEGDEDLEFNIKTDEDDLGDPADPDIDLREYQKELAKEGCEGENVIVIAPTNSGKTRVAFKIMQAHFRRMKQKNVIGKVIFIVENEFLANQQAEDCAKRLTAYRAKIISGTSQREKKQYLKDFVDKRDILIVTAQVLVNALKQHEIESLTKFSMIVFDECHHTNDDHPYNQIMTRYLDLKLDKHVDSTTLPQIVGLTAALSAGGNMNQQAAINTMKHVMANLDANFICTVRQNKEELKKYENPPFEEIVTCEARTDDIFRQTVFEIMDSIEQLMLTHPCMDNLPKHDQFILNACKLPSCKGSEQFIQWLAESKKVFVDVKTDEVRRVLNPCREALEIYNRSLLLHKDAQVKDAYSLVVRELQPGVFDAEDEGIDAEVMKLLKDLKEIEFANIPDNPKLIKMKEILVDKFHNDENARCLIFVKTRELARALVVWMNDTDELQMLRAQEFIGQNASAARGGMTKSTQKDAIDYFKGGRHKVLIATLGEEGLDITKCNLVIRYEHVTNEVVRLQSRGRARAPDSTYLVLTEEGSWKIDKEEKNAQLEILMNRIIPALQQYLDRNQNDWHAEMRGIQTMTKLAAERKLERREALKSERDAELQCLNCSSFICMSSDIKKIQDCHHVIVDNTVEERVLLVSSFLPEFADHEIKCGGGFFCRGEGCREYTLGGVLEYKYCEFPLVKICNFRVVYQNGKAETHKKWKNARFKVEAFTLDDLRDIVEERKNERLD